MDQPPGKPDRVRLFLRFIPPAGYMVFIYLLSEIHGTNRNRPDDWAGDLLINLLHVPLYAGLAFLWMIPVDTLRMSTWTKGMLVVVICILYGVTDEWHQMYVPGRESSLVDLVANTAGAFAGAGLYIGWRYMQKLR